MSTRQVAYEEDISNGSAYYVHTSFVDKGFVKPGNFKNNSRKGQYAYLLTPKGIREKSFLIHSFIEHKIQGAETLNTQIKALGEGADLAGKARLTLRDGKQ